MNTKKEPVLFILALFLLLPLIASGAFNDFCNRSCGTNQVQYPFGFSPYCKIPLNCSFTGEMSIGEFSIQSLTPDSIKLTTESKCNRSLKTLQQLFGKNFAPTARNAILLQSCSTPEPCKLPTIRIETRFEPLNCSSNSNNISCYYEPQITKNRFVNFTNLNGRHCKYFLSSISAESFNKGLLEVQVVEVGWWLDGRCHQLCTKTADCIHVDSPAGQGYRCRCKEGFHGDGYSSGQGCRKVSADCGVSNFFSSECRGATQVGILVGGSVAATSLLISFCLICCCLHRRSASKPKYCIKRLLSKTTGISIPIYAYKEIEKATNNFSEKQRLGTGAFGTVYGGKLDDHSWVAIKRIKHTDTDSIEQVVNEIKLLSSVSHPNLVRLLGCSIENGEQILVYEFMPNGTLCQHLQKERGDGLSWPVRLTIACETAQAIAHLHSAMNPPIYHRDIKSSNILLDYNYTSKVADFGLSRLGRTEISHISTAPQGTPGYLDPQYHQNFHLSDKSDVYSFGVVLVEIITGLKAVDFTRPPNEVNLANLATDRIGKDRVEEIIDPFIELHGDDWTLSSVHKVAELAFRCLAFDRDTRPSMTEVAAELEQIRLSKWSDLEELINCTASSEISSCSSSSHESEKPLSSKFDKASGILEKRGLLMVQTEARNANSMDRVKDSNSPVSVQDPWLSEQSSASSNSLSNNANQ